MSDEEDDYEEPSSGSGDMVEHIQKYKNYIQGLKKGQSSGISAAFGRASDLLPADVLEVAPPKGAATAVAAHELNERVLAEGFDRAALRTAVEGLILGCAEQLDAHIGTIVMTAEGPSEVVNTFVEDGQRKFMLANLDVIDEDEFQRSRERSQEELLEVSEEVETFEDFDDSDFTEETFEQYAQADHAENEESETDEGTVEDVETVENEQTVVEYDGSDENVEVESEATETESNTEQIETQEEAPRSAMKRRRTMERPLPSFSSQVHSESVKKFGELYDSAIFDEERPFDLVVHGTGGNILWGVHYDGLEIDQVVMADGTQIRRAEGRYDYVMVQRANDRLHPRVYILSGVMVDPETGNIYVEANQGGYTAAFLNNGWQIHQYRSRDSRDSFYAKEPDRPGRPGAFLEVINLALDVQSGEVTYETADSSATVTLKSRKL